MTLKEMYAEASKKKRKLPPTPSQIFIRQVAEVTKKSEIAVRRWLGNGETAVVPDALTQEVLAKHFKTTPEALFPKS